MDKNGYPEEHELQRIQEWDASDLDGLMQYLEELGFTNYGTIKKCRRNYYLSTGGWSGNEDIMGAMQLNLVLWAIYWYRSQCGGHYMFERRKISKGADNG